MKIMNVGIYDPYLDDGGGGEKYMLTIAEVLSQEHNVSVFWNNKEDFERVKNRFSLDLSRVNVVHNIFTKQTTFFKRLDISKKYDAIIVLSDGSIPIVRSKLYIHIQRPLEHVHPSLLSRLKIMRVSSFFCNSQFTKRFIDKTFKIHSDVIYPPVALDAKKETKTNTILHVGRFRVFDKTVGGVSDFKKQHVMIQVFKEMVDAGLKNWKFIMAVSVQDADMDAFKEMRAQAKGYPVEFEVNKSNASLWEYYSKAKIYWHASGFGEDLEKKPELAEHFGISTVEAMGAGAVPVVINAGGQKEIVKDGENGFTWKTLDEFKEKTMTLIDSKNLLEKFSEASKIRAQDFTKETFERKIKEMLS